MNNTYNPYAPPQAEIDAAPPDRVGTYRDGKLVRMVVDGRLPDRCVRCDGPAQGYRIERALYWRPSWWRWVIWLSLPVLFVLSGIEPLLMAMFWLVVIGFVLADIFVRRKVVVEYGLCERHRRLRTGVLAGFALSWVVLISLAAAGAIGIPAVQYWWFWLTALVMFALAAAASLLYRVRLARLTEEHLWLQGTGRPFYQALPAVAD